ncbi:MAG TPA: hypothetical protein PLR18_02580 [bacterium]|nr:hypothetical protein [bacterium]
MAKPKKATGPPDIPILKDQKELTNFHSPLEQFFLIGEDGKKILMILVKGCKNVYRAVV